MKQMSLTRLRAEVAFQKKANVQKIKRFVQAAQGGDTDAFRRAAEDLHLVPDGWRKAMVQVGRVGRVDPAIQGTFVNIWIEADNLPLAVGHRRTLVDALRKLLPPVELHPPVKLYRGAGWRERTTRLYGFSWTTDREIARRFAERWQGTQEGSVVLETLASPGIVLLMREAEGYYDEGEVVVDPFKLERVVVAERLASTDSSILSKGAPR